MAFVIWSFWRKAVIRISYQKKWNCLVLKLIFVIVNCNLLCYFVSLSLTVSMQELCSTWIIKQVSANWIVAYRWQALFRNGKAPATIWSLFHSIECESQSDKFGQLTWFCFCLRWYFGVLAWLATNTCFDLARRLRLGSCTKSQTIDECVADNNLRLLEVAIAWFSCCLILGVRYQWTIS